MLSSTSLYKTVGILQFSVKMYNNIVIRDVNGKIFSGVTIYDMMRIYTYIVRLVVQCTIMLFQVRARFLIEEKKIFKIKEAFVCACVQCAVHVCKQNDPFLLHNYPIMAINSCYFRVITLIKFKCSKVLNILWCLHQRTSFVINQIIVNVALYFLNGF